MTRKKGENCKWEPKSLNELKVRWERGDSAYSMGISMGCHATTIIKKAASMGLEPRARGTHVRIPSDVVSKYALQKLHDPEKRRLELAKIISETFSSVDIKEPLELCCTWIVEAGKPTIYCDEVVVRGKPYCSDHCAVAFRKPLAWEEKILTYRV